MVNGVPISGSGGSINTSSFATTGSNTFIGNQVITGSLRGIVENLTVSSNTASVNLEDGNFFVLALTGSQDIRIEPNNIKAGQNVDIKINTVGSGTVSFPTNVYQLSGSLYVPTPTIGVDIITLKSFDESNLYLTNYKNFLSQGPPNIITENLVAYYDAGNLSSYPTTGTSWTNLETTVVTQTLTNGPTFSTNNGGTINFDGTDDYSTSATNEIFNFGTGSFTIEVWFRLNGPSLPNDSGTRDATLFSAFATEGSIANTYALSINGNTTITGTEIGFAVRDASETTEIRTHTYSFDENEFYQVGISHNSGVTKFFVNGTSYAATGGDLTLDIQTGTRDIRIANLGYAGYFQYLYGRVGIVRVYKGKGLNDSEILQNYNANNNRI